MIKKIAYVDRVWGRCKDKRVIGDMGFSFNECFETRNVKIQEVLDECKEYALGIGAKDEDETYRPESGVFAIYEVYKADLSLENEHTELYYGEIEDQELIEVNVCATREVAGWIEEVEKRYKGVTINYREED